MIARFASLLAEPFRTAWRHRQLLAEMTRREIFSSRLGQAFALFWILAQPMLVIAVTITVFTTLFRPAFLVDGVSRAQDSHFYILAGLLPWVFLSDCLMRSANLLRGKGTFVRHFTRPLILIPLANLAAGLLPFLIQEALLLVYAVAKLGFAPALLLLAPALLATLALSIGLSLLVTAATVFSTFAAELLRIFTTIGLYLSPILFLPADMPPALRAVSDLNPLNPLLRLYQDAFFYRDHPHPAAWLSAGLISLGVLALGNLVFRRLSPRFAGSL